MAVSAPDIGGRLRRLRLQRRLALGEVATLSGLDISYLSRIERNALQNAKAKPGTFERVLDALDATEAERAAVYHVERPGLMLEAIESEVEHISSLVEEAREPQQLIDEHWYIWYLNRAARAVLGLDGDEYRKLLGTHLLHGIVDPENCLFARFPDQTRAETLAKLTLTFKMTFEDQSFDTWYETVTSHIRKYPWASEIWAKPPSFDDVLVLERHNLPLCAPNGDLLNFEFQVNHLIANPRFCLVSWTPRDSKTAAHVDALLSTPEQGAISRNADATNAIALTYAYGYQRISSPAR